MSNHVKLKQYVHQVEDILEKIKLTSLDQLIEIRQLKSNVKELEEVAESWMNDYQKLKDKYEPSILMCTGEREK